MLFAIRFIEFDLILQFSQSLGKNEEFYNEWLSGLTSLRSRVLFDVKQDLNDIKKLARVILCILIP